MDLKFLHGCPVPTVAILFQDPKEMRHVKTYQLHGKEKELSEGPWQHPNVEAGASMLIPVPAPLGGALIIGETTLTYQSGKQDAFKSVNMKPTMMRCWNAIDRDGTRYLLGDHQGQLYVLALALDAGKRVVDLKLELLGESSIAATLNYLDNRIVFVGSAYGDSQLVRLSSAKNAAGSCVEVLESWTNLGPIVDMCVVDLERQGQGQVVTCSGAFHTGSLRVIRNGIGISEQASIDLQGVKGIWSMRERSAAAHDKYLVVSFIHETHFLAISGDTELEETENVGAFVTDTQTLFCGNMLGDAAVQVTAKRVRLVDLDGFKQLAEWAPPADVQINHASCNASQVVVALGGGTLVYLELHGRALKETGRVTLEHEVACVNITPLAGSERATALAVGLWTDVSVRILSLPALAPVTKELLGGNTIPRSVLFASFEGLHYLLAGLGDGHLFNFQLDPVCLPVLSCLHSCKSNLQRIQNTYQLSNRKKLSLGTQPVLLNAFHTKGSTNVFASSDRPMVIYSKNRKLLYSNVNLKEVSYMCPFNAHSFPDSLAIATENRLVIGTIDEIQKLHIRTVPLGEMPRRIAHNEALRAFVVLTQKTAVDANGDEVTHDFVRLIDDQTFEVLASHPLEVNESGCSAVQCQFLDDAAPYFVVGTATVLPTESEPSRGRVLVFGVTDRKLVLAAEKEVKGAVYALNAFNGKLLASVNSRVLLLRWGGTPDGGHELVQDAVLQGHILALYLASRGDFFVVGDLLKSISLAVHKPQENTLEELARDQPNWMTAVEMLDDDTYLGAENSFNLFTVRKNADAATDEERARLITVGEFHLGEFVNRFRAGSLVMKLGEADAQPPTLVFGTVSGMIGVIASISAEQYHFFAKLQQHITAVIKGIGGFKHKEWRAFSNERKTVDADKFIDGDLIESFLDLSRDKMQEIAAAFGADVSAEDICKRIETLAQMTH